MCPIERKKLPVGIENFAEIRQENFYYVDKTYMIRDLLKNWAKVNLAPTGSYYTAYKPEIAPQAGVPVPKPYETFGDTFSY